MQAELFEVAGSGFNASRVSRVQTSWLSQVQVTLRIDHLLIGGILALVLYVLIFSFGVEQGKRYASAQAHAEQAKLALATETAVETPAAPPVQETAPAVPVLSTSPISGKYTIQLITFTSRPRAQEEVERLKKKGFQAFIIPQGKFFQVCAERFQSVKEAERKLTELRSEGFAPSDAYIRPLKGLVGV